MNSTLGSVVPLAMFNYNDDGNTHDENCHYNYEDVNNHDENCHYNYEDGNNHDENYQYDH